jgi:hypothetical protein
MVENKVSSGTLEITVKLQALIDWMDENVKEGGKENGEHDDL